MEKNSLGKCKSVLTGTPILGSYRFMPMVCSKTPSLCLNASINLMISCLSFAIGQPNSLSSTISLRSKLAASRMAFWRFAPGCASPVFKSTRFGTKIGFPDLSTIGCSTILNNPDSLRISACSLWTCLPREVDAVSPVTAALLTPLAPSSFAPKNHPYFSNFSITY